MTFARLTNDDLPAMLDLRVQLLDALSDADLAYTLPGDNPSLGALCIELGRYQQIYTRSFETLEMAWTYEGTQPADPGSVASLKAWFAELDDALFSTLRSITEEDAQQKTVDRGGFTPTLYRQLTILFEALLIYYGKLSVYLKAMDVPIPQKWRIWIG